MLPGWLGAFAAIALFGFLLVSLRAKRTREALVIPETHDQVSFRPTRGRGLDRRMQSLAVIAAAMCIVVGLGSVATLVEQGPSAQGIVHLASGPHDHDALSGLKDYARKIAPDQAPAATTESKQLPDVDTMIDRLAARLQTAPQDLEGWRLLGWSYFHTSRYVQATAAFKKALELDPTSTALQQAVSDSEAKAIGVKSD